VDTFLREHTSIYVIEANRDGQMKNLLTINYPQFANRMHSIAKCDGLSLSAEWICARFKAEAKEGA
jgi:2-oxoglutarate ferredoxin oxidoreductase subunit alpha